jgi:hypothetical protein
MKLTKTFIEDIRELVCLARTTVARGVDLVQVHTNFEIGRRIVEQEQLGKGRAVYGEEIIKALASRLTGEFGRGFSASNLAYMRSFYLFYQDRVSIFQSATGKLGSPKKLQSMTGKSAIPQTDATTEKRQSLTDQFPIPQLLTGQLTPSAQTQPRPFTLSWTHYVFLLGIKNTDERSFYEIESTQQNWTIRELKRQFDSSLYERLALSRDKEGIRQLAREGQIVTLPKDANIHAKEYQLYLPSKEELRQKLDEWAGEAGDE